MVGGGGRSYGGRMNCCRRVRGVCQVGSWRGGNVGYMWIYNRGFEVFDESCTLFLLMGHIYIRWFVNPLILYHMFV